MVLRLVSAIPGPNAIISKGGMDYILLHFVQFHHQINKWLLEHV